MIHRFLYLPWVSLVYLSITPPIFVVLLMGIRILLPSSPLSFLWILVTKPDENRPVFVHALNDCAPIRFHEWVFFSRLANFKVHSIIYLSIRDLTLQMKRGHISLMPFSFIRDLLARGDVELIWYLLGVIINVLGMYHYCTRKEVSPTWCASCSSCSLSLESFLWFQARAKHSLWKLCSDQRP